ncbi:MAG: DNA-directed RNA polymerase subunit omega [Clostridia bacterium]|nr:DNA-directed RNA polymerase subunit omega [Clostridia bacterium]MBQ2721232.1 DNA-directed RNA polymerase subunit omega [Clostridia bacterium]MBQ4628404.1 DNA-directed RNA polymerase subunit omega [Clostridia bacterium]
MLYPSVSNLIKGENRCRYSLVIAVAKQARYLAEKAEETGEKLEEKPIKQAVMSIADGKASFREIRNTEE